MLQVSVLLVASLAMSVLTSAVENVDYTESDSPEDFSVLPTNAHAPYRVSASPDWPRIRVLQGDSSLFASSLASPIEHFSS